MALGFTIIIGVIVALVMVLFLSYIIVVFNSIMRLKNNTDKAWSNIDVLLKQRNDEIPNLIAVAKGYIKRESGLFQSITNARMALLSAGSITDKARANEVVSSSVKTLFYIAENYPELKSDSAFLKLQERITGLENEIADRREFYNEAINNFNTKIESFPDVLIAKALGLEKKEVFKI